MSTMVRGWVIAVSIALVGALHPVAAGASVAAARAEPAFEPGACPEAVPSSPRVECGLVRIPEDRSKPSGRKVTLAVARIHPETTVVAAPPLLYLTGGPGDWSLGDASRHLDDPLVTDRDVVLVDLRGTGFSTPSLACPEAEDALDPFTRSSDDTAAKQAGLDALAACRRRLRGDGIDLKAYDYEATAADLADIRRALGIDTWDVYGISNGGRLALELVRRHPQGIRSLVLDASLPPQGNFFTELWPHASHAFDTLFAACADDPACAAAHPHLEDRFWTMIDDLRASPRAVTVTNPATGQPGTVVFDDRNALEILRSALYDTSLIPVVPSLIDGLTKGEGFEAIAAQVRERSAAAPEEFSRGQSLSVNCREEIAFAPRAAFVRLARELPKLRRVILDDTDRRMCEVWDVGRADSSVNRPVRSTLPALLLVGQLDPVHPLASTSAISDYLPNSTAVVIPGVGHGTVSADPCPRDIMRAFLLAPHRAPDESCVAAMPEPAFA